MITYRKTDEVGVYAWTHVLFEVATHGVVHRNSGSQAGWVATITQEDGTEVRTQAGGIIAGWGPTRAGSITRAHLLLEEGRTR